MLVELTESAEAQIEKLCKDNDCYGVSLNVKGGGCAGFEYDWQLVKTADTLEDNDEVIETGNGCAFVIGAHSIMFLIGSVIDYKQDIMGAMFDIRNPNAQSSCGCGVSVNFDGMF